VPPGGCCSESVSCRKRDFWFSENPHGQKLFGSATFGIPVFGFQFPAGCCELQQTPLSAAPHPFCRFVIGSMWFSSISFFSQGAKATYRMVSFSLVECCESLCVWLQQPAACLPKTARSCVALQISPVLLPVRPLAAPILHAVSRASRCAPRRIPPSRAAVTPICATIPRVCRLAHRHWPRQCLHLHGI
jgi:hypothetical protein